MQAPFNAILYGGSLPLAGTETRAGFSGGQLRIDEHPSPVPVDELRVRVGGFDHDELYLDWTDAEGQVFSLKPRDQAAVAVVLATAPPSVQQQMKHWLHRRRSIRTVWTTIGTLAAVLLVSAGLLWWRYDEVLTWVANHVSVENEQLLGNHVLEQIEADAEILREGVAVEALQSIGNRLTTNSRYEYQWYVQQDATVNAFALPGGIIIVNSALILATDSPEELAAVLAHEVQHVEGRHTLKSMINSLGLATAMLVVLGDVNAATVVIVHQVGNLYFSREIEEEADRKGFELLVRAGISPAGMISFFKKLQHETGEDNTGNMAWLSTHPETEQRINVLQELYNSQPCKTCQPLDFVWETVLSDPALLTTRDTKGR